MALVPARPWRPMIRSVRPVMRSSLPSTLTRPTTPLRPTGGGEPFRWVSRRSIGNPLATTQGRSSLRPLGNESFSRSQAASHDSSTSRAVTASIASTASSTSGPGPPRCRHARIGGIRLMPAAADMAGSSTTILATKTPTGNGGHGPGCRQFSLPYHPDRIRPQTVGTIPMVGRSRASTATRSRST